MLFKGCSFARCAWQHQKHSTIYVDKLFGNGNGNGAGPKGTGKSTHRNFIFIFAGESQKIADKERVRVRERKAERVSVIEARADGHALQRAGNKAGGKCIGGNKTVH